MKYTLSESTVQKLKELFRKKDSSVLRRSEKENTQQIAYCLCGTQVYSEEYYEGNVSAYLSTDDSWIEYSGEIYLLEREGGTLTPGDHYLAVRFGDVGGRPMFVTQFAAGTGSGVDNFLDLTDTPDDYTSQALKGVRVKADESGLEFYTTVTDTDEKSKVSSNDTTAGYLNGKLVQGTGITLTETNDGSNETLVIACTVTDTDTKVKVSSFDTTAGTLFDKLVVGDHTELTRLNPAGNEQYEIDVKDEVLRRIRSRSWFGIL